MKVYLFDAKTGLYEGESFAEAAILGREWGTTAMPPPEHGHGYIPVFDRQRQEWEIIPVTVARQLLHLPERGDRREPREYP